MTESLLRPGINFTNRGELKFARAAHLANELRGRIDEWAAAETLLARIHVIDEHTFEFRAVVKREPPIDEWALILGDALHNLRSAFDNVVWSLATLDGARPKTPTQVTFPMSASRLDWEKRLKVLESVPVDYLARLERLQPWFEGGIRNDNMFWLLHKFDIVDKHQGLISGAVHFQQLSTAGLDLRAEPAVGSGGDGDGVSYSTHKVPIKIENETVLTTVHSDGSFLRPDPDYLARVWVQFVLAWGDDRVVLLDTYLAEVLSRTREWLDRIYGGDVYARGLLAARQATSPSVTFGYEEEDGTLRITQLPMAEFDPAAGMSSELQDGERSLFEESNRLTSEPVPEPRHEH